jgi:hypothetical protein
MREEVWTKEESAAVDSLLAVLIDNQRVAIGGEIRGLLKAAHKAERERIREAAICIPEEIVDVRTFTCPPYPDNPMVTITKGRYIIPASVLAPKEADNAGSQ